MEEKKKVTICDSLFLQYSKSASFGGINADFSPRFFDWERADAQTARFVTDSDIKNARGEGQVAWLLEPFALHPENYYLVQERAHEFDAILMHSHLDMVPTARWYPFGGSWTYPSWLVGGFPKTNKISMLVSDKNTTFGHKLRHMVKDALKKHIDIFSDIPDKREALAPYEYSIIIESERTSGYFTEKLIDCLNAETIPIYWGNPTIREIFPYGIIECRNYDEILRVVFDILGGSSKFDIPVDVKKKNAKIAIDYYCCEDVIFRSYPELFEGD